MFRGLSAPFSSRAPAQKFGIYFGDFREPSLPFQMRGDTGAGLLPLRGSFQKKFSHPPGTGRLHEVEKWAVFESPATTAVLFAARQKLLHERCSH